ncbi:winged helix-turn-helix domain-containing protein [Pseudoalteromonas luteoviolacea]|uniref:OmpR/PhoB-type domain-containing protein n=1 Tax=Pseudoalteromonas luteoviolacea S4054 TaxID=1129367 RepID=A0A0F6AAV2_9GAMM|nr:winged helix-turn-helix domain-containing protein [Pseudoalteromonas luteoviolacea]AOT06831.1 hypothetical protein S4054249_02605 [Pseudoalteromonas luteoviolacea]AOT11749.1 hypothetical protein S40542_02605 [Pseudoalteromonas luteoviolacea]AOT16661.1 hypothetical protein S4054_02605 [Pseudoalteromonas luteoviolacea]KKE83322.1 hypothetical protein N479_14360 [Pseudoalteromonas luteoviolacea S4054]KZN74061.1 hypothetical protein N481_10125 [Pseudoalteromonas luteoviolacea S4047-1]
MHYYFEKYYFDDDTFTLYHNDKPIDLKSNEAKLLALFIKNKDKILSKDRILDEVWGEQVVSEQVVFQNISHLRRVFGNDAITTFSKKGYVWQLSFEPKELKSEEKAPVQLMNKWYTSSYYLYSVITLLLVIIFVLFFGFSSDDSLSNKQSKGQVYVIPFSFSDALDELQVDRIDTLLTRNKAFQSDDRDLATIDTDAVFRYSDKVREQAQIKNTAILLSGYVSQLDEQMVVEYKLLGAEREWHGYIFAKNEALMTNALDKTIVNVQKSGYLNEPNSALLAAKLQLLLEHQPDDLSVIYHLIKQEITHQNFDVARALIEKLLIESKLQKSSPYTALALYLKGGIFHQQQAYQHAERYYKQALALLVETPYSKVAHNIELALAWLAYAQHNTSQLQHHISNASEHARQSDDVLSEVKAQTTGSILSHKLGDLVNRYQYLNTAKSLLIAHEIEQAHFAVIHYHLALFSPNKVEAESYFLKLLGLKKLAKYQWIYESSIEDLLSWYIEQKRWKEAIGLFKTQPESSFNLNQKARVLRAQQDFSGAIQAAKQAFDSARLSYEHNNALHSALLLYQMKPYMNELKVIEYQNYIKIHASQFWIEKHRIELSEVGYFDDLEVY